jgi:Family of unknown function (DUF6855)
MEPQEVKGVGTREDPWQLKTPSGQSDILAYRDDEAEPSALVVLAAKTEVRYLLRSLDDLHAMLKARGDWMPLGSADQQKPAPKWSTVPGITACALARGHILADRRLRRLDCGNYSGVSFRERRKNWRHIHPASGM